MDNKTIADRNRKLVVLVLTLVVFVISIAGVTYAYFGSSVIGNEEASSARVKTTKKQLTYTDVLMISDSNTLPGWSQTKTFTVTNTGRRTASYNIIWRDITNSLTNDELVISATCSASSGSCSGISETPVYYTTIEQSIKRIKKNISIEPGVTHTYTVTIEFIDTDSNQDYNQRKSFRGFLNIEDSDSVVKMLRSGTDATTGLPVVKIGTEEFYDITNAIDYSSLDSTFKEKINYDSSKSILLAKYNLYVGQNCTSNSSCTPISTSAGEYGLQSADAKGYVSSSSMIAVVPFSGSSTTNGYWYDSANSTIYSKYGTSYNASNIYDITYNTAPNYSVAFYNNTGNANYSIAYYVEEYVDRLGIEGEGRLLTYKETNAMTTAQRTNGARFWLSSAIDYDNVWSLSAGGVLHGNHFSSAGDSGVRPVIVVDTADIKDIPVRAGTDSDTGLPKVSIGSEEFLDLTNAINYSSFNSTFKTKINYDASKSILLAKYNLYVGQNCTNSLCTPISTSDSRYGLQSVDAKGELVSYPTVDAVAVVPFSGSSTSDGYWQPGIGLDSKYGTYTNYANNIYDTNYVTAPDYSVAFYNNAGNENYSIAYYVEEYIDKLGIEGTGRLLTYPEANAMTATQLNNGAYYWLGSADSYNFVKSVNTSGTIGYGGFYDNHSRGIRPVIVVNTADIQGS